MDDAEAVTGKTILVIGATGFLGRPLVRRLESLGARVIAVSRSAPTTIEGRSAVVPWKADAAKPRDVEQLFRANLPEIVFHLTSDSRGGREVEIVAGSVQNDLVATINVLAAAVQSPSKVRRFIMTASLEEPPPGQATPVSPYAAAKWATGGYARMFKSLYGLDVRMVRPMMAYGPGQKDYKVVPSTILSLLREQPARIGSGSRPVDWVYVDDVVEGMVRAALVADLRETIDLGSGTLVTVGECAREIARQLDKEHLLEIGEGGRGQEIVRRAADVDVAKQSLEFEAKTTLSRGLMRTIQWYRARLQGA